MRNNTILVIILLLTARITAAQNIALDLISASDKYTGMAGAGLALSQGIAGITLNPAGLTYLPNRVAGAGMNASVYSYSLLNVRHEDNLQRFFDWKRTDYNITNALVALPMHRWFSIGGGIIKRLSPYLYNQHRAVTWSPLFNQTTNGGIYALTFTSAVRLNSHLSVGVAGFRYFGKLSSKIRGENHGNDVDKWARMESEFSGINFRAGAIFRFGNFRGGAVFEMAHKLKVKTSSAISDDLLYEYLLPDYTGEKLTMPMVIGLGLAYSKHPWTIALDIERNVYDSTGVKVNLYEYGGAPNWRDRTLVRLGMEYYGDQTRLPVRFGYAYLPQLYASGIATGNRGALGIVNSFRDTNQMRKHVFTAGTTIPFRHFSLNLAMQFAFLKWHREFFTYIRVEDDLSERNFGLSSELIYFF